MAATIIDGRAVAERIRAQVREQAAEMRAHGRQLKLAAVLVGESPASLVYARSQARQCAEMGIEYQLVQLLARSSSAELAETLECLNCDPAVTGIMLHMPLPPEIDAASMQYRIDPYKDVEGVNPANIGLVFYGQPIIAPCTALAVVELVNETHMELRGARAVVVGQGAIVGNQSGNPGAGTAIGGAAGAVAGGLIGRGMEGGGNCPAGQYYDPDRNVCYEYRRGRMDRCPEGQYYDYERNACYYSRGPRVECPYGQDYDVTRGRCY